MSASTVTATCKCGHPEDVHTALWPVKACTACTQCDGLLAGRLHTWKRCRCEAFEPRPRNAIEAEIAGDIEVLEPRSAQ